VATNRRASCTPSTGFFLDLAALNHAVYRAEHAAALADRLELLVHRPFHDVGQLVDDEAKGVRDNFPRVQPFASDVRFGSIATRSGQGLTSKT
jgi:hypothetical protein